MEPQKAALVEAEVVEKYLNDHFKVQTLVHSVKPADDNKDHPKVQVSGKFLHKDFLDSSFSIVLPPMRVLKGLMGAK